MPRKSPKLYRFACALLAAGAATAAHAGTVPLSYAGRLGESDAKTFTGRVHLEFRFFRAKSDNTAILSQALARDLDVTDGFFQVDFTDLTETDLAAVFPDSSQEVWIEVTDTTNNAVYPRQRYATMPFALRVPVDADSFEWNAGRLKLKAGAGGGGTVTTVGSKTSDQVVTGVDRALEATAANTASKIVARDASGNVNVSGLSASNVTTTSITASTVTADSGLRLKDTGTTPHFMMLKAPSTMPNDVTYTLPATPVPGAFLQTDVNGLLAWTSPSGTGDITEVLPGTGLTGGAASGAATLAVDVGTTTGKIVQVAASDKLPAIDGSLLTNLSAANVKGTTSGAIPFGSATGLTEDPTQLFWNNTLKGLGIGVPAPAAALDVRGTMRLRDTGSNYIELKAPATVSTSTTYQLPQRPVSDGMLLSSLMDGTMSWISAGGVGTVTSVGITPPSEGLTASAAVTASGNITLTLADDLAALEGLATNGYAKRTATSAWSTITTVPVVDGGTGATGLTANGVLLGNGTAAVTATTAGSNYAVLRVPGAGGAPAFGAVDLGQSAAVTGFLSVTNGGTGASSFTYKGMVFGNAAGALQATASGAQYEVLQAGAGGTPAFGPVDLGQSAAVTGVLPVAQGGTGSSTGVGLIPNPSGGAAGNVLTTNGATASWSVAPGATWTTSGGNTSLVSGNLGIGTTAPSVKLHTTAEDSATAVVTDVVQLNHSSTGAVVNSFGTGLLFTGESTTTDARNMSRIQSIWTTATDASRASALQFQTLTGAGSLATQMTIDGTGNIGIGTAAPSAQVHIKKSVNATLPLRIENPSAGTSASTELQFMGAGPHTWSLGAFGNGAAPRANDFYLYDSIGVERLTVTTSGTVGIGVTAPTVALEVGGSIKSDKGYVVTNPAGATQIAGFFGQSGNCMSIGTGVGASASAQGLGTCTLTFAHQFSAPPSCVCSLNDIGGSCGGYNASTTSVVVKTYNTSGSLSDSISFSIQCFGTAS